MHPTMRSAFSCRYEKSGSTRSMPSISRSGNISPQSSRMIEPSTSMHAQLRPISPRPPRNVTVTESAMQVLQDGARSVLETIGCGSHREPTLPCGLTQHSQHCFRGDRVRVEVTALEVVTLDQSGVQLTRPLHLALLVRRDHLAHLAGRPVG